MLVILLYLLITIAFLSFSASVAFSYLNLRGTVFMTGLFYNTTQDLERKYFEYATPDTFVYGIIWPIIYITNAVGVLYMLVGAFVPPRMSPVKVTPSLTPPFFLLFYSLAFGTTVGWIFAYDSEILPLALAFLLLGAIFAIVAVALSSKRIQDNLFTLEIKGKVMMWMIRILVQNPLAILATWLVVASMLTMTDVILYHDSFYLLDPSRRGLVTTLQDGSLIGLGVLLGLAIIWFILENFVWEKYCRYIFTVYPVLIFSLSGVIINLNKNFHDNVNLNSVLILASVEISFFVMAFLLHIGHLIYRVRSNSNESS